MATHMVERRARGRRFADSSCMTVCAKTGGGQGTLPKHRLQVVITTHSVLPKSAFVYTAQWISEMKGALHGEVWLATPS
jgi:hypothetical protein